MPARPRSYMGTQAVNDEDPKASNIEDNETGVVLLGSQ